jgi:predicted Rossmann-fold nucleotide-binding protein
VLNVNGYYDSLAAFLDDAVDARFLPAQHRDVLIFEPDPETLLARMAGAETPTASKWLTEAET